MSGWPASVLIVDDDEDVGDAVATALGDHSIGVLRAFDGEQALRLLRTGAMPCAIILDWSMPRLDGDGFLAARASSEALSRIPVFVTSGSRVPCGDPRSQCFLPKPIQLDDLLEVVRSVCARHCHHAARASCPRMVAV
jgi:DNA-binding response OmpR family regulator